MVGKKNFSVQVDEIVSKSEKRLDRVMKASVNEVVEIAQTPTAKGGRMKVDTGFLRASGRMSLNGMPSGPSRPSMGPYKPDSVELTIGSAKIGDTFFFGWTANYAKYREAKDGFLITALQQWPDIVKRFVEEVKQRIK